MSVSACAVSQHEGGDNKHGEESQGREEEGRQEAVTSPVRKKGGGRRPLFTFLPTSRTSRHEEPVTGRNHPQITQTSQIGPAGRCVTRARRSPVRRPAARRSRVR